MHHYATSKLAMIEAWLLGKACQSVLRCYIGIYGWFKHVQNLLIIPKCWGIDPKSCRFSVHLQWSKAITPSLNLFISGSFCPSIGKTLGTCSVSMKSLALQSVSTEKNVSNTQSWLIRHIDSWCVLSHPSKQLAHRDDSSTVHSFQHFPGRGGRGQRVRITIGQWENDLLAFHVGNFREWFQSSLVLIIIPSMFTSNVIIPSSMDDPSHTKH